MKINDPVRRANIGHVQAAISGGRVFRGRRRIFQETLAAHIAEKFLIPRPTPERRWFLSDLWFEAAADYSPGTYGFELSPRVLEFVRRDPARSLFDYLLNNDEAIRLDAVRNFSTSSTELIADIEARRAIANKETLALRKRAYGARLVIDEIDFILTTGRQLGLDWRTVRDVGSSMIRSIVLNVPILNVERELAVRLESQSRDVDENDLRDMASFTIALPLADVVVAEKPFVNLARQARLGGTYSTKLMTSIFDFLTDLDLKKE
jgi:hypothetical protein